MRKGHIFFIMGISGAGKGTLIKNLKKLDRDFYIPLSYKTRPKREFEIDGVDAYFITKSEFENGIKNGEFLEYAIVHNSDYYGTKFKDVIENGIDKGKIVIKELDILGLRRLKKEHPEFRPYYTTVFLNIPINKLEERIKQRGEKITKEQLEARKDSAIIEEEYSKQLCDYIIDATQVPEKVLTDFLNIVDNVLKNNELTTNY